MPAKSKNSISEQLNAAQIAITNTLSDPEILGLVSKFGYDQNKILEGQSIYQTAVNAVNNQIKAAGAQFQATDELKKKEKLAREAYQNLANVARAVFIKDKAKLAQLGITGKMPIRTAEFIYKGYAIFENAVSIDEIRKELAHYGYDDKKLKEEKQKIVEFDQANQRQEAAKGEAQQSTKEQEVALKNLKNWLSQYIKIAKVALKDDKQLLEKIGVGVYSSKTAAQRQAPQKAAATRKNKQGS